MKTEKSGGRPKKETSGFEKEKTIGFQNTKSKTKPNENDNVNENENENENDNVNENENENENENVNVNVNGNDNEDVSDSCVDGLQEIIDFYNENIGMITSYGIEILSDYAKEMSADLIIYAMQISVEANKKTIQYIKAILNNWQKAGIKTLADAKRESKNGKKNNSYEQRKYDNLDFLYNNLN